MAFLPQKCSEWRLACREQADRSSGGFTIWESARKESPAGTVLIPAGTVLMTGGAAGLTGQGGFLPRFGATFPAPTAAFFGLCSPIVYTLTPR